MRTLSPRRPCVIGATLLALALLLAACGDGGTTVTETVTAGVATTTSEGPGTDQTTTSGASTTTVTGDVVKDCADLSTNITTVSVRNISCDEAVALMTTDLGPISNTFTLGSFECARVEGNRLSGVWRCTDGDQAIRFSFGD